MCKCVCLLVYRCAYARLPEIDERKRLINELLLSFRAEIEICSQYFGANGANVAAIMATKVISHCCVSSATTITSVLTYIHIHYAHNTLCCCALKYGNIGCTANEIFKHCGYLIILLRVHGIASLCFDYCLVALTSFIDYSATTYVHSCRHNHTFVCNILSICHNVWWLTAFSS